MSNSNSQNNELVQVIGSGNAFHSSGRAHACYLAQWPRMDGSSVRMLIDFGATSLYRLNQLDISPNSVSALFLTHFHGDHMAGVPFLLLHFLYIEKRDSIFTIIGPPGVEAKVRELSECMYPGIELDLPLEFLELTGNATYEGARLEARPVNHRPESVALRLGFPSGNRFAFSGDAAFDSLLWDALSDTDLAIMELSVADLPADGKPIAHVSLEELEKNREKIRTRRLIVSHIYDELAASVRKTNSFRPGFAEAAFDGLVLNF
ncbi:MAG: MBL fold metallo-hydrolase [Leptospiraceae bacterium]|nr:MBL fold metallo-hydrolase [Leptospiraceae bacterium]MCB1304296.1 MBL fold metallo-hydrolase [Leptospiraceae bacterium]